MSVVRNIEWMAEGAWIGVLQDSADVLAELGSSADVHRDYDLSAADALPAVTVQAIGARPLRARGDGYYIVDVAVTACTSMDDDQTGETRADLAGAIRDVFEDSGLLSDLATNTTGALAWTGVEQPEMSAVYDDPVNHVRELTIVYECTVQIQEGD